MTIDELMKRYGSSTDEVVERKPFTSVFRLALFLALSFPGTACRAGAEAPTPPPPPQRQALKDAWWTGPLLAPGAGTLPRGHILIEPYLYGVNEYGSFDSHGTLVPATHQNTYGSLTYFIYGLTDRFNAGLIPTFGYTTVKGSAYGSRIGIGDWSLLAQYRLTQFKEGKWIPTTALSVQETFPTGRYDNLGSRPADGQGSGAYSTRIGLYSQTYVWLPNGRILRARLNLADSFSQRVPVSGVSVYGTPAQFTGYANPGSALSVDAALEYSMTRNWVLASDVVYSYEKSTLISGEGTLTVNSGDSHSLALAPAVEYNLSPNLGIIAGVRLFPLGSNASASVTPVMAINIVR